MRILLITSVYKNEVVGPARFARLLESNKSLDVDILTTNIKESASLKSVDITFSWWQKKLKNYFSIGPYSKKIVELKEYYDVLLFNSSILVDHQKIESPYVVMVNDEKLASLEYSFNFDFLRRSLHRQIEKKAVQNASKVIVNSNYLKGKITKAYGIDPAKVSILYKGISLENKLLKFNDELTVKTDSKKEIDILFVKNDFLLGGLEDLIAAIGSLKDFTFNLIVIGTNHKIKKYLIQYPNVNHKILGFQSNDVVIESMYKADILCIPSRFEPLGVAVMEGLAVGVPTITTGMGGLREVTNNGKYVWECKPNDSQDLAEQIMACISNPKERVVRSNAGKEHIHQKFDFKNVIDRLKAILPK